MNSNAARKLPDGLPEVLKAAHQVFITLTTDRILRIEALTQAVHKGQDPGPALTENGGAKVGHGSGGMSLLRAA
ncbi:hypothetical protein PVW53_04435 [Seohaeicola sp. SP36]|uniref:hypothetical protein n=1 Tax=unclassified Seohaeicola TaxID=2641111 RepID=UPI00237AC69F|nr:MULTISPECIES: hypothetical protein [unclassified Seohaeicola]MDD9706301.1 hypothetical protein [Seohaeicola sp. 4SK31]MDD9734760.1 hypothetical protein [Seohaeicola sp. SP36]